MIPAFFGNVMGAWAVIIPAYLVHGEMMESLLQAEKTVRAALESRHRSLGWLRFTPRLFRLLQF